MPHPSAPNRCSDTVERRRDPGREGEGCKIMRRDIWIFLFVLGLMFFSWPLMSIFKGSLIPYLFISWLVFIALICITAIFSERDEDEK
jgi:hypothetical protein